MRQLCTFFLLFGLFSNLLAQNIANGFWTLVAPEVVALPANAKRTLEPKAFKTFHLNYDDLNSALKQAPMEFTSAQPLLLDLPQADGSMRQFRVWESPIMEPELAAKFPEIRNYAGTAANGSGATVRLGVNYQGFHAFFLESDGHIQSVRPYADGQNTFYMAYRLEDLPKDPALSDGVACGTESVEDLYKPGQSSHSEPVADRGAGLVSLKTYRAAIAAKGEYTVFFGGTKPLALSAINTALNFIVLIQERDFAVRFQLIGNNDAIIFTDSNTDPYTGNTVGDWMGQNPAAINPILGLDAYDVGHVFAQFVMGNQVGVVSGRVCVPLTKARGCSSAPNPATEYFYLVAAHEMGHQLSASHTWSNCPGIDDQLAENTAFEPGSGSTIMSYAGSCPNNNNVQNDNDSYYHLASILQVQQFVYQGDGNTCGTLTETANNMPDVSIPIANSLYIPIKTPFRLIAVGSDSDGDALTYCWEQYDLGPTSQLGEPEGNAPSFRSFTPTSSPSRTFPRLPVILANGTSASEALPDTSRTLTFRVTARDNKSGGGGTDWAETKLLATHLAGPFRVTYPNTGSVTWNVGQYETITWDVANTDLAPVNCKKVNILLSIDGGNNFPITVASGVPNVGKACIQVPNNASAVARIRIESADNVFFDLSNAIFKIQQPTQPGFSFCPSVLKDNACTPANYVTEINTNGAAGFNIPITFSASGLPVGAVATFSPNPVQPGSASTLSIDFPDNVNEGTFDLAVVGIAGSDTLTSTITLTVIKNDFSALALLAPANGIAGVDIGEVLRWNAVADADEYEIQVATSPSFGAGTIVSSNANIVADSFKVTPLLNEGQVYYWRIRPKNDCGDGAWTTPFVFVTRVQSCLSFVANDLPKNISANGTPTVESQIIIPSGGQISDVNIKKIQGNHTFMKDLEMRLISPAGTNVLLFKDKCASYSGGYNIGFDDSANGSFPCPPPLNGTAYKPTEALSAMTGQNAAGTWILRVKDNASGSGGQLIAFELQLCSSVALGAPFLVNNNLLQVAPGTNAAIGTNLLKVDDPNNGPDQLVFTLVTVPKYGDLRIGGSPLAIGVQFTQSDINNGLVRYYDYGSVNPGLDDFLFAATDGEGGLVSSAFSIQQFPVGAKEPSGSIDFDLDPNPATESARLFVSQPFDVDSRVTLFNVEGQLLRNWMFDANSTSLLLEIADLPKGLYVVSVENEKGKGVKKVVVR